MCCRRHVVVVTRGREVGMRKKKRGGNASVHKGRVLSRTLPSRTSVALIEVARGNHRVTLLRCQETRREMFSFPPKFLYCISLVLYCISLVLCMKTPPRDPPCPGGSPVFF